jgi:outer membrane receptor protein involved in Fe transport
MKTLLKIRLLSGLFCVGLLFFATLSAYGTELDEVNEEAMIEYLQNMEFGQLTEVEVSLDEVFDVFDGLIKKRRVKVATGAEQSAARAPSVTTVITSQDIEATGARNLDEVLETVPGLHVARRSSVAYDPIYTFRGIYSDDNFEVLKLVNNIPVSTLTGGILWAEMPVNAIARIEIIRGPGSAVFGADAFAGVINIITKDDINGTETGIRVGSFDTQEAWVLHGSHWGGFDVALALEYHTTDGQREIIDVDAQTQFDKAFNTNASLAPGSLNLQKRYLNTHIDVLRGNWQLRAGLHRRRNVGSGAGLAQALDPHGRWAADRINTDLTYHNREFTQYWDVTAQLSYFSTKRSAENNHRLYPPGAFRGAYPDGFIGNPGKTERHSRLGLSGFYSRFYQHLIRVGAGYHYGDLHEVTETKNFGIDPATGHPIPPGGPVISVTGTPYAYLQKNERKDWYFFLQDAWTFASLWELTAGLRYDHYSDFGSTLNPRIALVWQAHPKLTTKFLYGRAFRAPSFLKLYTINNPVYLGNPDLNPEIIETWELASDYRATDNLHFAFNLFTYDISDKIVFVTEPGTAANRAQNAGIQKGHGLELESRWKMSKKSSLLINYAFQKSTDENNDHDVGNAPHHQVYLRTDWLLYPNWYLDAQLNWVADRKRPFDDPRDEIDDYATVDLTLRRKNIGKGHWNFAVSVRNLFDEDAREPSPGPDSKGVINMPNDLPLAGRSFFGELRYKF